MQPDQPGKRPLEQSEEPEQKRQKGLFFTNQVEVIKDFLAPFLEQWKAWKQAKSDDGIFCKEELEELMLTVRGMTRFFLSDLVAVCEKNPVIISFLKEEVVLPEYFWDIELRRLHKAKGMPKNMSEKRPLRGHHSLDAIFGYVYAYRALAMPKEQENRVQNVQIAFNKAVEFNSLYGLLDSIRELSDQMPLEQETIELELLNQIQKVNHAYGTPGYVSSAYFLFGLATKRPQIAKDCLFLAALYTHVAEKIMPHCQTAMNNLDPFDQEDDPELPFASHAELFESCKRMTSNIKGAEANHAILGAAKEVKVFLDKGLYDLPSQNNVVQFSSQQ